jgi:PAS domain S-box-containing protein
MPEKEMKILFVDDNPQILSETTRNFMTLFDIETAVGSQKALEAFRQDVSFAVVVSDVKTAGMNAYQLFDEIRKISPNTVFIIYADFDDIDKALVTLGSDDVFRFVPKEFDNSLMVQCLSDALNYYRQGEGSTSYTYSIDITKGRVLKFHRSKGCYSVTGYSARQIENDGDLAINMILPEYRKMHVEHLTRIFSGQEVGPIEFRITRADGSVRWLRDIVIPHRNHVGEIIRCDGLVEDITSFKDIGRKLCESEIRFETMASNIPGVVFQCILKENGNKIEFVYISKSCVDILNYSQHEIIGSREGLCKIFDDASLESFRQALIHSASEMKSCNWQGALLVQARERRFQILAKPRANGKDEYIFDGLIFDITVRRRTEMELIRANQELRENSRLQNEFVSTVSHELRTPLFIFKNIISNAMAGVFGSINSKLRKNLEMADTTIDRLSRIISDFLDSSRIEARAMNLYCRPVSMQEIAAETAASFIGVAKSKKLKIETMLPKEPLMVNVDRDRMTQVLTNLIGNAVKFSNQEGVIKIFVNDHLSEVEVAIQDEGPGIDQADIGKIFSRFVQVNKIYDKGQGGTGLGLSIAKELIELHKGRIWVDSKPGQGSCFSFVIPKYVETEDESQRLECLSKS